MTHPQGGVPGELTLRVTPPRVPRNCLVRSQLNSAHPLFQAGVLVVQAPAGFGKTFLLTQWRLEHLAQGAVVAWVSVQPDDDRRRLVQCLALSVRLAAARPTFCHTLLAGDPGAGLDGITTWLAEVAQSALNVVLMLDDVERLNADAREVLGYLMRNLPPNLRLVVGVRADCRLDVDDLLAYGDCVQLGPPALRFQLEETLRLIQERFQGRIGPDVAARLHEITEGWPLGLQLALAVAQHSADPAADVAAMAAGQSTVQAHLMDRMLAQLAEPDVDFLMRVSVADHLHPGLCESITTDSEAESRLERLCRDTPVLVASEQGDWLRLHTLARKALQRRFELLPLPEQSLLHARAAQWLADAGRLDAAARHALAAGRRDMAFDLAERSLYESLMTRGHQPQVLEWLDRMPAHELDHRPRMLLAAAWSLALSERNAEAGQLVTRIQSGAGVSNELDCECALILSGAAVFADDPDRFARLHDPWGSNPPLTDPLLLHVHANRTAYRTLIAGDPALARLRQQQAPHASAGAAMGYLDQWGELVIGLTYLWEGQVILAEKLLRPTLARTEIDLGRRHPFTCMLAAFLAAALWEQDRSGEAVTLLAHRLDVLERRGLPEAVLLAFRTLARAAVQHGPEHRAIELLDAMHALGVARSMPRLCVASLTEQIRMHARRYRAETCKTLLTQIEATIGRESSTQGPLWMKGVNTLYTLAQGYACVAARRWREALGVLAQAQAHADGLHMGRLRIEVMGLRAFVQDQCGERSLDLAREALDLARAYGLKRVFIDVHPEVGAWMAGIGSPDGTTELRTAAHAGTVDPVRVQATVRAPNSLALTPKEREVLDLLSRNLTNKEIGLALQVGEETIKWHMKNLFAKLDAGNRKQLVGRARLFGLID